MNCFVGRTIAWMCVLLLVQFAAERAQAQLPIPRILPEQRTLRVRDPSELPHARMPESLPPPTVAKSPDELRQLHLSLDEAIRWSLTNAEVVRVLAGVQPVSSGNTIYDAAITNTQIDEQQGQFDPNLVVNNRWNRSLIPRAPGGGDDGYQLQTGVNQKTLSGAQVGVGVDAIPKFSTTQLSLTQPLLKGFGRGPNLAPVVVARIDTERSYFQMKDSMQENVRSVVEAYWALVNARVLAWTRKQQVIQSEGAFQLAEARMRSDIISAAEVAQARATWATFKAQLVEADGAVLQREAALRNLLGFPPADGDFLVPVTPPANDRYEPDWQELVSLAEERRPDLVELKLIIEADEQLIVRARNQALPQVDAVGAYRWNGLEGEMPITDWTMAVNFSVPLGLRQPRATLRRYDLILARDRANLQQGLHAAIHQLATTVRSLAQAYGQYVAFREAREAAMLNLRQQQAQYSAKRIILLNVLQAITDWGNAVNSEANALMAYNTLLASLERQTGTILETHGVVLYEESFGSIGPLGRLAQPRPYPRDVRPTDNDGRYKTTDRPAEDSFNLVAPAAPPGRAPRDNGEPIPPPPPNDRGGMPMTPPRPRPLTPPAKPPAPDASQSTRRTWQAPAPIVPAAYQR